MALPYRLWMLLSGYMSWCNKCHSIVSGGFGYKEQNKQKFKCADCAMSAHVKGCNRIRLGQAASFDPNKKESL